MSAQPTNDRDLLALVGAAFEPGPVKAPASLLESIAADVHARPRTLDPLRRLRRDPMPTAARPFAGVPALTMLLLLALALAGAALVAGAIQRLREPSPLTSHAIPGDLWVVSGLNFPQLTPVDTATMRADREALPCTRGQRYAATTLCSKYLRTYAWSPDGETLAYVYAGGGGGDIVGARDGLYLFREADDEPRFLAGCGVVNCTELGIVTWTRNGMAIAAATPGDGASLVLVDPVSGATIQTLDRPGAVPQAGWPTVSISSDGTRIAWSTDAGLFTGNVDGTDAVPLTDTLTQSVTWSRDGSRMAYAHTVDDPPGGSRGQDYRYVVTVADGDGSHQRDVWSLSGCCHGGGFGSRAAISPDGSRVAVIVGSDLYLIDVATGTGTKVDAVGWTLGFHPVWRP